MTRRPLATRAQVAEYFDLSPNTVKDQVYRQVGVGRLAFRVGKYLRWDWDDIDAYVAAQKQQKQMEAA
ncbi:helix-turn-helix transcriptional regulator [Streptomyces coelicoflavus]|uniref:helix-turn-helix transcriptional regulator n=1 Tax=Streptomyces coelicoflavus TaxID=285562 RepID=UPI00363A5578